MSSSLQDGNNSTKTERRMKKREEGIVVCELFGVALGEGRNSKITQSEINSSEKRESGRGVFEDEEEDAEVMASFYLYKERKKT
jgi:hypothetical protein